MGVLRREEVDYHVVLELDLRLVEGVEDWIAHQTCLRGLLDKPERW